MGFDIFPASCSELELRKLCVRVVSCGGYCWSTEVDLVWCCACGTRKLDYEDTIRCRVIPAILELCTRRIPPPAHTHTRAQPSVTVTTRQQQGLDYRNPPCTSITIALSAPVPDLLRALVAGRLALRVRDIRRHARVAVLDVGALERLSRGVSARE